MSSWPVSKFGPQRQVLNQHPTTTKKNHAGGGWRKPIQLLKKQVYKIDPKLLQVEGGVNPTPLDL